MINIGAELRLILDRLRTVADADITPGYWIGDTEAERRDTIDQRTKHHLARQAFRRARTGLDQWDAGDVGGAAAYRDQAVGILANLNRAGFDLQKPAIYGRPASDRDGTFARLVDTKRKVSGAKVIDCIFAVLAENPDLARLFATRNPESLQKAYRRGQKA